MCLCYARNANLSGDLEGVRERDFATSNRASISFIRDRLGTELHVGTLYRHGLALDSSCAIKQGRV